MESPRRDETDQPIFVIGPSSVGKSHLSTIAAAGLGLDVPEGDEDLRGAPLRDWSRVRPWLDSFAGQPSLLVLGAGTQDDCIRELITYLRPRRRRLILVIDDPEAAFERNRAAGLRLTLNQLQEYIEKEVSERRDLYALAGEVVDYREVGQERAPSAFTAIVRGLLGR